MSAIENKIAPATVVPGEITLLAVSPYHDDHQFLKAILEREQWTVRAARSCAEACRLLREYPATVVMCERDLPDGDWRQLLNLVCALRDPPPIVVVSRHADECLWAEVLNLGGYDVLAKPFDKSEVSRVVNMAWRYGRGATHRQVMAS